MPTFTSFTALTVALSATLASAQFLLPEPGKPLDLTAPIKVAWGVPLPDEAKTLTVLDITARLDWGGTYAEKYNGRYYDVALNRSSSEPGEVEWDTREVRAVVEANGTYPCLQFIYTAKLSALFFLLNSKDLE